MHSHKLPARSTLPPGIPFLLRIISIASTLLLAVYATARLASACGIYLPMWVWIVGGTLTGPAVVTARIWLKYRSYRLRAEQAGAVLAPELEGKTVGGYDVIRAMVGAFNSGYISDFYDMAFREVQADTFLYNILWNMEYNTKDPEVIKAVLATDFTSFEKGELFRNSNYTLFGMGVFDVDGELWKFHRSMTRPFFSRERISHVEIFERHAAIALDKIRERAHEGAAFDFQELVSRFTLDSATEFLFGSCVHSLRAPLLRPHERQIGRRGSDTRSTAERFPEAFSSAQRLVAERFRLGALWPLREILRSEPNEHMAVVDAFLEPILSAALQKREERELSGPAVKLEGDDDQTLLDHLVEQTTDPQILRDEVVNILLAGRDTTASALSFGVYLLCQHPPVLARLRQEIAESIGFSQRPTYDDIRNMKYLRAFLNETMRLYPPVPLNLRASVNDVTVPNPDPSGKPWFIPAKVAIVYSTINMHRDPKYWGPTAAEFDPDRFLDERLHKYLVPNPFIFLPFNAGPRICLGQQFAYNEMSFFIIRLLQTFASMSLDLDAQPERARVPASWKACEGRKAAEQVWPKVHMTLYAEGGVWVKMQEADVAPAA